MAPGFCCLEQPAGVISRQCHGGAPSFSAGAFSATRTKVPKGHGKPIAKTASLADANESLQREWELLPKSCSPLGDRTRAPVLLAPQSGGELRFVLRVT